MSDGVYYRILLGDDGFHVACMQWFDEPGYDHSRYLLDHRFETEAEAQAVADRIYAWIGRHAVVQMRQPA